MKLYKSGTELRREIEGTRLPDGAAAIWALGQAGFLIRIGDKTVAIDPYLTNSIDDSGDTVWKRKFAPPLTPDELPELDALLVTHHHEDHMDAATLRPLQRRAGSRFVIPQAHAGRMTSWGFHAEQLIGMNHLETQTVNGVEVTAHAAMHDRFEQDEQGAHLYLGYVFRYQGVTICHTGDTVGFPELEDWLRSEDVDVLLIPINGRDYARTSQGIVGNANYREAADLAAAAGVDLIIPMHFGMFPHNDENPAYFVDYMYSRYPQQKFHMMTPGERFVYMK